jgi:molybdate transport system substrate-binding protein
MARGAESTALLAAGDADLALEPVSELVDQTGIEPVGELPDDVQLIQMFTRRSSTHLAVRSRQGG